MYEEYFGFSRLPFSITPDPRFFYDNAVYREAYAALRYGVETRKGFVVITGEAGTGKTTLLKVFMHGADSTIHSAFIFNPKLNANELLRFILNDLGVASATGDRVALLRQLNDYLIQQLRRRHTVALLVDEAQELSNELLEELRLLSNLETNKDKLIQIVLMGQPELEARLEQPELRQLKQRVALRCQLASLKSHEVYFYIDSRLRAAEFAGKELFDPEAVERITLYSKGIPRLVNVICDNALLIAYAAGKKTISVEMIEEVARDLQFSAPSPAEAPPATELEKSKGRTDFQHQSQRPKQAAPPTWVSRRPAGEFRDPYRDYYFDREVRLPQPVQRKRHAAGIGIGFLLGVALAGGLGMLFHFQPNGDYASDVSGRIEDSANRPSENQSPAPVASAPAQPSSSDAAANVPAPMPEEMPIAQELKEPQPKPAAVPDTSPAPPPQAVQAQEPAKGKQITKNQGKQVKTLAKRANESPVGGDAAPSNEKLEFEIYKAIANRAIRGVAVSVSDGTAYLSGRVATERQKLAASMAARGVPGVKSVRDRIVVDYYGVAPRYSAARMR